MTRMQTIANIGAAAFCDNGAMIDRKRIAEALDVDRGAGFRDPSAREIQLLICGDECGGIPADVRARHPALESLLMEEMT